MTLFARALIGTTTLAILAAPLPALAHATLEVASAPANATYKAVLRLPHGCDGQPTHTVAVTIPEGFVAVKPMPKAGWTLETVKGPHEVTHELDGETVASGVTEVRWSGGNLPDEFYDEFVLRGQVTGLEPGTVLPFKVVQTCANGEVAWIDVAAPGQDPHDLPFPAPMLTVVAATGHGGHGGHGGHDAAATAAALSIETAWMRQPPPGANVAGGYMVIRNGGAEADRLIGASVAFADRAEIHEMAMDNGVMQMKAVAGGLEIPPGGSVELSPGGYHLMMMGLTATPKMGESVPVTLTFEQAGAVEAMMTVASMGASSAPEHDHGAMPPTAK